MKWLLVLMICATQAFAADRAAIQAINTQLDAYLVKQQAPAAEHNRIMVFVRPLNLPGYIHASTFPITKVTANEIRFNIPNSLELRSCEIAPSIERILIRNTGADSLVVNMIENRPLKISCLSQNLSKYLFISYKQ